MTSQAIPQSMQQGLTPKKITFSTNEKRMDLYNQMIEEGIECFLLDIPILSKCVYELVFWGTCENLAFVAERGISLISKTRKNNAK